MPVGDLVDLALSQPLNAIEAAIKQQDAKQFAAAYDQLSQGCNACHMELDHPYVVIKPADASAFPNQDFKPAALGVCARLRRRGGLDAYQGRALPAALRQTGQECRAIETIGPLVGCGQRCR